MASSVLEPNYDLFSCSFPFLFGGFHLYLFPFNFNYIVIYFDMVCYLKQGTCSVPISYEAQRNDIWTDNIQSFAMPF